MILDFGFWITDIITTESTVKSELLRQTQGQGT
jgi:hypothetical protein